MPVPEQTPSRYELWCAKIDLVIRRQLGVDLYDCPDICPTRRWFDEGVTPEVAAKRIVKACKKEYGF